MQIIILIMETVQKPTLKSLKAMMQKIILLQKVYQP